MKKLLIQVLLIILLCSIGIMSVFITNVEASQASVSASSVNAGDNMTVTLNVPGNVTGAQADITVKFADGQTKTNKIVYLNGMSSNSITIPTSGVGAGAATITASNIIMSDGNGNTIESGGSASTSASVNGGSAPVAAPAQTQAANSGSSSGDAQKAADNQPKTTAKPATTTKAPAKNPAFKDINEQVYAKVSCNVRSSCTTDSQDNVVGGLEAGQEVTRTGSADGWSRIKYDGGTAYVASRLLTTEKPEETEEKTEEAPEEEEKTEEKSELDLLKENIGVLPEVGNNAATIMYIALTILMTIACGVIVVYLYKKDV